ncbi:MAG TPA: response regulator [Chitinophagaceae bacterium]|jgi:DNA-binding NtrC family response regulator|nr:response regulator [Chitinophagaceae bacterium]
MRTLMENKLKALIVDDEIDVCYLLSAILNCKNFQASYVNSISEAKRVLLEESPSIVFLDNHLPDGFGISFIEEIKKLNPLVKIVMITAYDTNTDRDKAYQEGVDYFIGKPFTRETIFKTLENLLN